MKLVLQTPEVPRMQKLSALSWPVPHSPFAQTPWLPRTQLGKEFHRQSIPMKEEPQQRTNIVPRAMPSIGKSRGRRAGARSSCKLRGIRKKITVTVVTKQKKWNSSWRRSVHVRDIVQSELPFASYIEHCTFVQWFYSRINHWAIWNPVERILFRLSNDGCYIPNKWFS